MYNEEVTNLADAADVYDFVVLALRELADHREMSLTAASVLGALERFGPQRITAVAEREGISQPSATQLALRLEARELVARGPDPADARATLVEITDQGREAIAERRRVSVARMADLLAELPAAGAQSLAQATADALPAFRARSRCAECASPDRSIETADA